MKITTSQYQSRDVSNHFSSRVNWLNQSPFKDNLLSDRYGK